MILGNFQPIFAADGERSGKIAPLLSGHVDHLHHPKLLRIDALGPGVVERDLDREALRGFKQVLDDRLAAGRAGSS